ncbi:hypothetical protein L6452_40608 [Arctium lappa]|uniref:Uncharacterized protein n=1 Tax=Arctium lappa TaxID=4217 RepID=A0ACB8XMC5_ARCLA|nr:hypothetical protein L6452_40608 [Arctium lappa]
MGTNEIKKLITEGASRIRITRLCAIKKSRAETNHGRKYGLQTEFYVDSRLPPSYPSKEEFVYFKDQCLSEFEKIHKQIKELMDASNVKSLENKVEILQGKLEDKLDKVDDSLILLQEDVSKSTTKIPDYLSSLVSNTDFISFHACMLNNFKFLYKSVLSATKVAQSQF